MTESPVGTYMPLDTPIHRANPLLKLLLFIGLVLLASMGGIPGKIIVFLTSCVSAFLARTSFRTMLRSVKAFLPFLLLILFMNVFFFQGEHEIRRFWIFRISREGILRGAEIFILMTELILLSLILHQTTTSLELTGAAVKALSPLKKLGVKTDDLALVLSVTIRFIPILMEESQIIVRAQKARGAKIGEGKLTDRARSAIPLVIPIFLRAFRRADELTQALLARGYKE